MRPLPEPWPGPETFSSAVVSETYSGTTTSGVLTLTSGGTTVASIDLIGSYVTSDFKLSAGTGGSGTIITDPQGGSTTIAGGSVLDISAPDTGKVTFAGSNGTLVLDQTATFSGTVASFGAKDHIDLASIAFGAPTTLGYTENSTNTGGILTISDGDHAASIALLGNYIAASFVTTADGHGGTLVSEAAHVDQQSALTKPHA
jgi:hypothetical protein